MYLRNSLSTAIVLCAVITAASAESSSSATMGQPEHDGDLEIHIVSPNGGLDVKSGAIHITLPCTPEQKAQAVYNKIKPILDQQGTAAATISGNTVTITIAGGAGLEVTTIKDTTGEPNKVKFEPGSGNSTNWVWKFFRLIFASNSQIVLPPGSTGTISFDSPMGFALEPMQGDGVHTLEQLEDDLSARMATHGVTFTKTYVSDPASGDYILYTALLPSTIPTQAPQTFEVDTSAGWSDWFGTFGLGSAPQPMGTPYCFGDGTNATPCPCGNFGAPGAGCNNSSNTGGAQLYATGVVAQDTVTLNSVGELPSALSIFLQGNANQPQGQFFGDGVRCVGGTLKRIAVDHATSGFAYYPHPGDASIRLRSAQLGDTIPPGAVRFYQAYYRDPQLTFCPQPQGNSWNVSNAVAIVWQ